MSFVSPEFALAALLFYPLFWRLKTWPTLQLAFLTLASYLLYATWSTVAALTLLGFSIYIWLAGEWINRHPAGGRRRLLLSAGLTLSLSLLVITKYYEFTRQLVVELLPDLGLQSMLPIVDIVTPAGISFYSFQAVTYLVWRYRSPVAAMPVLRPLAFLSFWPTLFAGPILRADDFVTQTSQAAFGRPIEVPRAIYLLLLGLIQKMVLASWMAEQFVDPAFRYPQGLDAFGSLAAIFGYSMQIFLDFSGYSLIVTGLALLLGFTLPVNFAQPYLARNLREFWHRWHISLSTFIRDYVYIPLGGNRHGAWRAQLNIMAAMLISGVWHGANTTFLLWGALHGLGVVLVNLGAALSLPRLPAVVSHLLTMLYVGFAWVFFRASSFEEAIAVLAGLSRMPTDWASAHLSLALFGIVFFLLSTRAAWFERWFVARFERWWGWRLTLLACALGYAVVLLGPEGVPGFIYYRF